MKKIFSYAMMCVASIAMFTSCADDNDSNPKLVQPTSFVLNNPAVGAGVVDLAKSTGFDLSWSQPKFTEPNAPVNAVYTIELSSTGKFTKKYDAAADDNTGADYYAIDETSTTCTTTVDATTVAKALQILNNYEDKALDKETLSVRVKGAVQNAAFKEYASVYSNVVTLSVLPYYVELKDATPVMWYLVGNMFGGKWGKVLGESALPMFLKDGYAYDKKTGNGEIEYLNWFGTGDYNPDNNENGDYGWKIQRSDFDWNFGMTGNSGVKGDIIYRNGGNDGGHILAPEDGVYLVTMNTDKLTATMEKYTGTVKNYGTIQISGGMNGWSDTPMSAYNKDGVENHAWYYVLETSEPVEFKFKIEGSWDSNWGSSTFPTGIGTNNGPNIKVEAGKWFISFCDITGAYSIIAF